MDRLTIPNGGMPLEGDDFNWMQGGIKDALKGVLHAFASPYGGSIILSGFEGSTTLSEGYCMINYEVCYFPGASPGAVGVGQVIRISLESTYDPAGLEVFADSVSKNTYEKRRARVDIVADTGGLFTTDSPRLVDIIRSICNVEESNVNLAINQNSWVIAGELSRARKIQGRVYLRGKIRGGTTNQVAFVLPVGYRPLQTILVTVAMLEGGINAALKVETNGNATVVTDGNLVVNGANYVSLYGVDFPVD